MEKGTFEQFEIKNNTSLEEVIENIENLYNFNGFAKILNKDEFEMIQSVLRHIPIKKRQKLDHNIICKNVKTALIKIKNDRKNTNSTKDISEEAVANVDNVINSK